MIIFRVLKTIMTLCYRRIKSLLISLHPFVFFRKGISARRYDHPVIISLTSFPERVYMRSQPVQQTVISLLNQTIKPNIVVLWLAEEEFPRGEKSLPYSLRCLKKNGLTIRFTRNYRSYKKLLPALQEFTDAVIVTADDDVYYPRNWFEKMFFCHNENPNDIIAHRGTRILFDKKGNILPYCLWDERSFYGESFLNFFTGCGGVLYPPHCLHTDIFDYEKIKKIAPHGDDLYIWAMALLKGTKIYAVPNGYQEVIDLIPDKVNNTHLCNLNCAAKDNENDKAIHAIIQKYPQITKILKEALLKK